MTQYERDLAPPPKKQLLIAAVIGTTLEWYDFMFFGTLAALVISPLFFPEMDPLTGQLSAFATFGVAFIARPLGALFFGHLADRFGRKISLTWTILLMGGATVLMGILPTHATLGATASVLLVALRIVQGLAVGGEWGSAATMLLEYAPPNERARYTVWVQTGGVIGPTLGSLVVLGLSLTLSSQQLFSWGWRLPFFVSVALVAVGFYIRRNIPEPPASPARTRGTVGNRFPLVSLLRHSSRELILVILMYIPQVTMTYLALTFFVSYTTGNGVSRTVALTGTTIAGIVTCFLALFGRFFDRTNLKKLYLTGCLIICVAAFPLFALLNTRNPLLVIAAITLAYLCSVLLFMLQGALFTPLFDAEYRATGASVGVQLGSIVGGGFAPAIATALLAAGGGHSWMVSLYIIGVALIGAVAAGLVNSNRLATPDSELETAMT